MMDKLLVNSLLSEEELAELKGRETPGHPWIFAIVGDISILSNYCRSVLLVSDIEVTTHEFNTHHAGTTIRIADIEKTHTRRMYGNAMLCLELKNGLEEKIFRYTFSVNTLCEGASTFINSLVNGEDIEEATECMKAIYEKQLSVCPKCGRTLASPGAECLNCASKKKLVAKLGKYIVPEWKKLIISVILSIASTALALVPPMLTRSLVDEILPNKDAAMLTQVVIALISLQIVSHLISGTRGYVLRLVGDRIVSNLRNDVYEKAQYLPMRFYDKTSTGAVINRISGDSSTIQSFMLRITQEVVVQFFKMIGIVVVMLVLNPKLTLLSLVPVPLVVIGSRIFGKKIRPFYLRIWRRWTAVSSILTDTIPGIRVVKSFTNEKNTTARFKEKNEEWYKTDTNAAKILNAFPAIVGTFIGLGSVVIWAFGGTMVIEGNGGLTVGLLVSFIS